MDRNVIIVGSVLIAAGVVYYFYSDQIDAAIDKVTGKWQE